MALWRAIRTIAQGSAAAVGLVVQRFSSGATSNLLEFYKEDGTTLNTFVGSDGHIQTTYIDSYANFQPVEWRILSSDSGGEFRLYNVGAGNWHFRSFFQQFGVPTVTPGYLNPYNSLTALRMGGLATSAGVPTSNTWAAGDWFIDSKGVPVLCTTGGAIGTAVFAAGGWQLAGFYKFASALTTSGAVTVGAFDELMIVVNVISMSAATEWPALRFNGDTATNYSHGQTFTTAGTSATDATATVTNRQQASAGAAKIAAQVSAGPRVITCMVNNTLGTSKVGSVVGSAIGTGAAATLPVKDISGQFEWVNTSAQITSVTMLTMASGANTAGSTTFGIGSGFQVFGRDRA